MIKRIYRTTPFGNDAITTAGELPYNNGASGLTATDTQAAVDEVVTQLSAIDSQLAETDQRIDAIITTPVPTGEIIAQEIIDARQGELSVGANLTKAKLQITENANLSPKTKRLQLHDHLVPQDGRNYYSFSGGVNFQGKEYYVVRAGNGHFDYTDPNTWGHLVFFVRQDDGTFTKIPFEAGSELGWRDPWLGISPDGQYLILKATGTTSQSDFTTMKYTTAYWVLNADLSVAFGRHILLNDSSVFPYGNLVFRPDGKLLMTAFWKPHIYGVEMIISANADYKNPGACSLLYNLYPTNDAKKYNETTIGYWNNELIAITRCEDRTQNTKFRTCTKNDGGTLNTDWSAMDGVDLGIMLDSPVIQPYNFGKTLIVAGSYINVPGVKRVPAYVILSKDKDGILKVSKPVVIDNDINGYGGYPSLVPNKYGYGVMYFSDYGQATSDLFFKDVYIDDSEYTSDFVVFKNPYIKIGTETEYRESSGIIKKIGVSTISSAEPISIINGTSFKTGSFSFATPFPNACLSMVVNTDSGIVFGNARVDSKSAFMLRVGAVQSATIAGNVIVRWEATGY